MDLAMEIPLHHMDELSKHTDFDFALAHKVLEYGPTSPYVKFYKKQSQNGRTVWLDNSYHELGESIPLLDLVKAAKMINATHIVAPEVRDDPLKTNHLIEVCKEHLRLKLLPFKVVGVWQGFKKDMENLQSNCDEVALPWIRPRNQFLTRETSKNFHYFGFRTLDELYRLPPKSVDTSIPIRAVLEGIDLETRERRPKTTYLSFETKLKDSQLEEVLKNINLLKKAAEDGGKWLK